jgi:hypothetical protein
LGFLLAAVIAGDVSFADVFASKSSHWTSHIPFNFERQAAQPHRPNFVYHTKQGWGKMAQKPTKKTKPKPKVKPKEKRETLTVRAERML